MRKDEEKRRRAKNTWNAAKIRKKKPICIVCTLPSVRENEIEKSKNPRNWRFFGGQTVRLWFHEQWIGLRWYKHVFWIKNEIFLQVPNRTTAFECAFFALWSMLHECSLPSTSTSVQSIHAVTFLQRRLHFQLLALYHDYSTRMTLVFFCLSFYDDVAVESSRK